MKLNFLNVLNKKSTPDEIAEQIAALEEKAREAVIERDILRASAKDLRQRKLCGESITDAQVKEADSKVESAVLDLEAIEETKQRLATKLIAAFEAIKEQHVPECQRRRDAIGPDRQKAKAEVAKAKARLLVAAEVFLGPSAEYSVKDGSIYLSGDETDELYHAEVERCREQVKHPTYHEKKCEIDNYGNWLNEMSVEEEVEKLLNKYRPQAVANTAAGN